MGYKVFLDANILLDFLLRRGRSDTSKQIIEAAIKGQIRAFTSSSIIHIVSYWLTKSYGGAKAKELILSLLADVHVIEINHEAVIGAISSGINDIEDSLQYYTALQHKLDYFVTRDKKLLKMAFPTLPIYLPEDFLKELRNH